MNSSYYNGSVSYTHLDVYKRQLFDHLVFVFIALIDQANTRHHHDADQEVVQELSLIHI